MQPTHEPNFTRSEEVLAVSLELSSKEWKIALDDGRRTKPTVRGVNSDQSAKRLQEVVAVIEATKQKWGLAPGIPVAIVYEAGQDGFWIERELTARGYRALVVNPASIQVSRQARRAKTDRLDAVMLVRALRGWLHGERDRMSVVHVPTVEAEDCRQASRERGQLQKEIGQHRDRIGKLLRLHGSWGAFGSDFGKRLAAGSVKCQDGSALPPNLQKLLQREWERLQLAQRQFDELEQTLVAQLPKELQERIAQLQQLKAIGAVGARRLILELFWREFDNRRQVGACVGLVPQPYNSGLREVDQGISKSGNRKVRALLIELAWFWLRYQPQSALSRWFRERTAAGAGKRLKRIAIVAVARRLAILLWRYVKNGELPADVQLKAA